MLFITGYDNIIVNPACMAVQFLQFFNVKI